jgi:aminopeptidase Y
MFIKLTRILIATVMFFTTFAFVPGVLAGEEACDVRVNNTLEKLLECVTLRGVREHQAELQAIADANNGIRTSGTPGFDQSIAYAEQVFTAAGYNVTIQPFQFQTFISLSPAELQVISPISMVVPNNIFSYSGSGDVTATVTSLPLVTGCNAADYAGFSSGTIALISRGACTFAIKATNAYAAGAVGVIIYNNAPGSLNGTLGNDFSLNIPVTSVTQDVGQQLISLMPGLIVRLKTDTFRGIATTYNIFAETVGGNPENVVMVGAHLDSVNAGPGIQDNGSGSAAILEVAQQMAKVKPVNKVRFALWGAEESGLVGSTYYINNLSQEQRNKIVLYLNFDMIGSPNHVFFIYDGDDSDGVGAGSGPAGSAQIEKLFEAYYTNRGIPFKGTDFTGRSDYGPFIAIGIPSGGLFTGAEGIKSAAEAALFGGTAGQQYDPCYHLACDTYSNVNEYALDVNSDAVAYSTLQYAMNTSDINAVKGKGNFPPVDQNTPGSTGSDIGSGGGLHDDDHEPVTE